MRMGQVWSKADFNGRDGFGTLGGRGSVLAVTAQNPGPDGVFGTADDVPAYLNPRSHGLWGVQTSIAMSFDNSASNPSDRVREFASLHTAGANFVMADGSVHFIRDSIDYRVYVALSTIQGGEVIPGDY
ncbi:MAG TPA: DUF1559 domain-containing protein [Gemmataceae bacterium]|nr:DUF1559 domain-containing protein [Gemmataceae bacterium]